MFNAWLWYHSKVMSHSLTIDLLNPWILNDFKLIHLHNSCASRDKSLNSLLAWQYAQNIKLKEFKACKNLIHSGHFYNWQSETYCLSMTCSVIQWKIFSNSCYIWFVKQTGLFVMVGISCCYSCVHALARNLVTFFIEYWLLFCV